MGFLCHLPPPLGHHLHIQGVELRAGVHIFPGFEGHNGVVFLLPGIELIQQIARQVIPGVGVQTSRGQPALQLFNVAFEIADVVLVKLHLFLLLLSDRLRRFPLL